MIFVLQFLLKRWGETLNARNEEYKRSIKGKMASATHTQTVAYMKPLFRHLKQKVPMWVCVCNTMSHLSVVLFETQIFLQIPFGYELLFV